MKQTTKKQQEELLEAENEERKEDFFMTNYKHFRYQGCQCHLKHEAPPPDSM